MYVFQYAIVSIFFLLEIAMLVSFMYWVFIWIRACLLKFHLGNIHCS